MPTSTQLRSDIALLTREVESDLSSLWRGADTPELVEEALRDLLPGLIDLYGSAAATVAADWYDDLRDEVGARGRFTAIAAEVPQTGSQALVGWALAESTDMTAFESMILGGTQRRIANFSRLTVTGSSIQDPAAVGWKRVGDGDSCSFCRLLLGRGAVYRESTADFQAHDRCGCTAAPEWR